MAPFVPFFDAKADADSRSLATAAIRRNRNIRSTYRLPAACRPENRRARLNTRRSAPALRAEPRADT